MNRTALTLFVVLVTTACSRRDEIAPAPAPPPRAATAAPISTAVPLPGADPAPGGTLSDRLGNEARARVKVAPTADDVLGALAKAGVELRDQRQSLGKTYDALYCTGAWTKNGELALTVCEYPDEATATKGRDASKKMLAKVAGRDVWRNKATTLAIIDKKVPGSGQLEQTVVGAFERL